MSSVMCRSYSHIPLTIKKEDFIFTSPHKSLLAKGIFANLTLPAEQGHRHNSEFQRQIEQLLIQATRAGIKTLLSLASFHSINDTPVHYIFLNHTNGSIDIR